MPVTARRRLESSGLDDPFPQSGNDNRNNDNPTRHPVKSVCHPFRPLASLSISLEYGIQAKYLLLQAIFRLSVPQFFLILSPIVSVEKVMNIVEIKAVKSLADEHRAQLHNYLKATGMRLGLLVNFGHYPKAEIERIVL